MFRAVDVRTEFHALFAHLADTRQREYLKTTTIGQHRTVEAIELVQSAGLLYHIQSRT